MDGRLYALAEAVEKSRLLLLYTGDAVAVVGSGEVTELVE